MQPDSLPVSSRPSRASPRRPERRPLAIERPGRVPYAEALELQDRLVAQRRAGEISDTLLLLEHPHVLTLGTAAHHRHVLIDEQQQRLLGIETFEAGRGGDVTYHGPGQLVGYPVLDLKPDRCDLHRYVRDLEDVLIRAVRHFGISAARRAGLTGVWVADAKIAAIGVRVSSGWITSHGFALNVTTDLAYFDAIVPCGIRGLGVTSIQQITGVRVAMADACDAVAAAFAAVFDASPDQS
jgi:lipoyl(octanoyl) transferase